MVAHKLRGFTLAELLVVIAIISMLVGISVVTYRGAVAKSRDTLVKSNAASINKALAQYYTDNGKYPLTSPVVDINTAPNEVSNALVPNYLRTTSVFSSPLVARYTINLTGGSYAQAWQLHNQSEGAVITGNGVYTTDSGSTPGSVSAGTTTANAVDFNGVDQLATVPDHSAFDFAGDFAVSFWVKITGTATNGESIVEKHDEVVNSYPFRFRYNSSNGSITLSRRGPPSTVLVFGTQPINSGGTDGWHHVVGIKSGGTLSLVIDNTTPATAADASPVGAANNNIPIYVGGIVYGVAYPSDPFFAGSIDDLRIYNTALTTGLGSRVESLYNAGHGQYGGQNETGLLAAWRFDEASGATLINYGPSGAISPPSAVNATITGGTRVIGNVPLGLTGIGNSLLGKAFVTYGPQ